MSMKWTYTRDALRQLQPTEAGKYLTRLVLKGPKIYAHARGLMEAYPLTDDRFKILMVHYLRETLPGDMETVYEAVLKDIMADKPQLQG